MKQNIARFCAFLILLATNVHATTQANTATLTLGGGYEYFASKRHISNSSVPLVMLGYNFTEKWGIEGLLGVINSTSHRAPTNNQHVHGGLFLVDGIYHFTVHHQIEPFVIAGVGITGLDPNGNDARNEGNINAGVGLLWFASDKIALRIEGRDIYTITGGKNDVLIDGGVTFNF